jgi:hypothetical protein
MWYEIGRKQKSGGKEDSIGPKNSEDEAGNIKGSHLCEEDGNRNKSERKFQVKSDDPCPTARREA